MCFIYFKDLQYEQLILYYWIIMYQLKINFTNCQKIILQNNRLNEHL